MAEQIVAQVTLRSRDGSSILDAEEPVTSKTVARYRVEDEVVQEARQKLAAYGFEVVGTGPYGFSISGSQDLFARVFHVHLERRETSVSAIGTKATKGVYHRPKEAVSIPEDLAALVAGVAFPMPPELTP